MLFHDQTEETDGDRARQREGWPAAVRQPPRSRWQPGRSETIANHREPTPAREALP